MKRTAAVLAVFTIAAAAAILIGARSQQPPSPTRQTYRGWPAYGGGPEQIRYSRLDQINRVEREAAGTGVDLRQRRNRRSANATHRRRRRAVCDHADAQDLRLARGDRRAPVDVRLGREGARAEPRRHVLERRFERQARLRGGQPLRLRARRRDRKAHRVVRHRGADRSAPGSRTRSRAAIGRPHLAGRRPQRPADSRRAGLGRTAGVARRRPRLRRTHRQAALELSHHPASRREGIRDVVEGLVAGEWRREQLAGDGARPRPRHRLRADGIGGRGLLRRQPRWRQPLRQLAARAQRRHRKTHLALSIRAPRHLGSRLARSAQPDHDST